MNILIVNQSVIDLCASFFTLLTATVEVDGNKQVPMRPLATITVACRGGRHSSIIGQHRGSVGVSLVAYENSALGIFVHVDLQHSAHDAGALRCRHLSALVPQQRKNAHYTVRLCRYNDVNE